MVCTRKEMKQNSEEVNFSIADFYRRSLNVIFFALLYNMIYFPQFFSSSASSMSSIFNNFFFNSRNFFKLIYFLINHVSMCSNWKEVSTPKVADRLKFYLIYTPVLYFMLPLPQSSIGKCRGIA